MSRKTRTTLTVVEKLIEQRRLFQDWLTKLAGDVDGMPGHVVERVKNDYRARFDAVMRELGEHREALREAADEAQERHGTLETQHQAKKDELAELRLRRQVGEIDEVRFKDQSGMMKTVLDGLQKEMAAAERELQRYEEILDVIARDEKKPAAPPPSDEDEDDELEDDEEYEDEEEEEEEEPAAPVRAAPPPPAPRSTPPPPPRPAPAPEPRKAVGDDMAFLRSITPPTGVAPVSASPPPAPAPRPQAPPPPEPQIENFDAAPGLVHIMPEPSAPSPGAAGSTAKADDEGLVCGECGALNRPTEWYCEKCGAELAAL